VTCCCVVDPCVDGWCESRLGGRRIGMELCSAVELDVLHLSIRSGSVLCAHCVLWIGSCHGFVSTSASHHNPCSHIHPSIHPSIHLAALPYTYVSTCRFLILLGSPTTNCYHPTHACLNRRSPASRLLLLLSCLVHQPTTHDFIFFFNTASRPSLSSIRSLLRESRPRLI
jgi:hypothetical protein